MGTKYKVVQNGRFLLSINSNEALEEELNCGSDSEEVKVTHRGGTALSDIDNTVFVLPSTNQLTKIVNKHTDLNRYQEVVIGDVTFSIVHDDERDPSEILLAITGSMRNQSFSEDLINFVGGKSNLFTQTAFLFSTTHALREGAIDTGKQLKFENSSLKLEKNSDAEYVLTLTEKCHRVDSVLGDNAGTTLFEDKNTPLTTVKTELLLQVCEADESHLDGDKVYGFERTGQNKAVQIKVQSHEVTVHNNEVYGYSPTLTQYRDAAFPPKDFCSTYCGCLFGAPSGIQGGIQGLVVPDPGAQQSVVVAQP